MLLSKWPPGSYTGSFDFWIRRHGFPGVTWVSFGISISNFMFVLFVSTGRISCNHFQIGHLQPYWIFWFPDFQFSLALNILSIPHWHIASVYAQNPSDFERCWIVIYPLPTAPPHPPPPPPPPPTPTHPPTPHHHHHPPTSPPPLPTPTHHPHHHPSHHHPNGRGYPSRSLIYKFQLWLLKAFYWPFKRHTIFRTSAWPAQRSTLYLTYDSSTINLLSCVWFSSSDIWQSIQIHACRPFDITFV